MLSAFAKFLRELRERLGIEQTPGPKKYRPTFRLRAEELEPRLTPATLDVSTLANGGAGSLRAQIAAAAPGDTIDFTISGTISLTTGQIAIAKDLTIDGTGQRIVIDAGNNSRVFYFNGGVEVESETVKNLRFTGGAAGANAGNKDGGVIFANAN